MGKWIEIKVLFDADEPYLASDLIADVFYGFTAMAQHH